MPRCSRVYQGVRCKGFLASDGAGGLEVCTLCSRPAALSPHDWNVFYTKNAAAIIEDIRAMGRAEARKKWNLSKDALTRQEKRWIKKGLITIKERAAWTSRSNIRREVEKRLEKQEPAKAALASSERGRKKSETEKLYSNEEIKLSLGQVSLGENVQIELTLKAGKKNLVRMIRSAIDEG